MEARRFSFLPCKVGSLFNNQDPAWDGTFSPYKMLHFATTSDKSVYLTNHTFLSRLDQVAEIAWSVLEMVFGINHAYKTFFDIDSCCPADFSWHWQRFSQSRTQSHHRWLWVRDCVSPEFTRPSISRGLYIACSISMFQFANVITDVYLTCLE